MNEPISKLAWRCKRGIREMDIVFQAYLKQYYEKASTTEQEAFIALIDEQDLDVMNWILGRDKTPEQFQIIIKTMQTLSKDF